MGAGVDASFGARFSTGMRGVSVGVAGSSPFVDILLLSVGALDTGGIFLAARTRDILLKPSASDSCVISSSSLVPLLDPFVVRLLAFAGLPFGAGALLDLEL